eukprot:1581452-Pleurochrysis_carterae.AAC.1
MWISRSARTMCVSRKKNTLRTWSRRTYPMACHSPPIKPDPRRPSLYLNGWNKHFSPNRIVLSIPKYSLPTSPWSAPCSTALLTRDLTSPTPWACFAER